jgi:hypothetical protein
MSDTATIYSRDGTSVTLPIDQARNRTYLNPQEWSLTKPPPPGWDRTIPQYRASCDLNPAPKARFQFEPPFAVCYDGSWQYGTEPIKSGDIIETKSWPHPSFRPLNYSAGRVLDFFNLRMKSRMGLSPFRGDRIELNDGISGALSFEVKSPQVQPMNLRPVA